ncbi:DUF3088 family protein [Robbsia andropogonis]|uniref:DUF3088 family protein n=1 Tax=Robbsia andropogonis TaxID=28092 RepID=UPI003D23B3EA
MTKRDTLFLLDAGFSDPQYPGERFLCPDGAAIEGLLASDRARAARLDIIRVPFPKPREAVVAALDAEHQGVPLLILGDEQATPDDAKRPVQIPSEGAVYFLGDLLTLSTGTTGAQRWKRRSLTTNCGN